MSKFSARLLCVLLLFAGFAAKAETRAWIDRDTVALGDTLTLNIETDSAGASTPDYAPLQQDFDVSGNTSNRQVEIVNGGTRTRTLFAVALQPRRQGLLTVPALKVGSDTTPALSLTVTDAAPPARAGSAAFIEAEADDQDPYVQQAVGYTLRLYYATPLTSGQLDQPPLDGASLQRVGEDLQYTRMVGGKRYTVVERRFLMIPERSGPLTIPGARFEGRGAGGFFDDMFGDGQRTLRATGAPRMLTVRPVPAKASQPWLPLRSLTLRYLDAPQSARAGDAATLTLEARADGASAAQMPDLKLQDIPGAQVFADPPQTQESFENGRPRVTVTRKFSIVPSRTGALHVPGPRIEWWDVRAGTARVASVPDLSLDVAQASAGAANPSPLGSSMPVDVQAGAGNGLHVPGIDGPVQPWALATMVLALLWLATLAWGLHRGTPEPGSKKTVASEDDEGAVRAARGAKALKRAIDTGTLGEVADVLGALSPAPGVDLDAVHASLDDDAQREAVAALQRARWGDGDAVAARASLRRVFGTPRWKRDATLDAAPLPPLYPVDRPSSDA